MLVVGMLAGSAAGGEWIGGYRSDNIPGYEIVASTYLYASDAAAPLIDFNLDKRQADLKNACINIGGVALTNIDVSFSLGNITGREGKTITTYGEGIYSIIEADCVTKTKKK